MLGTLSLTIRNPRDQVAGPRRPILPILIVLVTGGALIWGTLDMPHYGDPNAPAQQHVAPRYIQESGGEIGVPNIVTSVSISPARCGS